MNIAVYRAYYGAEWIGTSIKQLLPYVDKVVVFYFDKPWYNIEAGFDENENLVPLVDDGMYNKLHELKLECGIEVIDAAQEGITNGPFNTNEMFNYVGKNWDVSNFIFTMTDYVEQDDFGEVLTKFIESGRGCASTRPIRMWKDPQWQLPFRDLNRIATMMFSTNKFSKKCWHSLGVEKHFLIYRDDFTFTGTTLDFGFALNELDMEQKLAIRTKHAKMIPDEGPDWSWFRNVWKPWNPLNLLPDAQYGWCQGEKDLGIPVLQKLEDLPKEVRRKIDGNFKSE